VWPYVLFIYFVVKISGNATVFNLSKPTAYVMHHQFNIQQLYALLTLYLCVLYLSQNKQRLVPLTELTDWFLFLEGSSFTSIMTYTRGSGYSF